MKNSKARSYFDIKNLPPFFPADFFEVEISALKKKKLPDFSSFLAEVSFAQCTFAVRDGGIALSFDIKSPCVQCLYPPFAKGDAVEVMIDTRGIKTTSVMHKYGHHFVILPKEVDGVQAVEITKFHGEDKRPYVDLKAIDVQAAFSINGYKLDIFFGEGALFGFDPQECPRIGFSYRIHRTGREPMHFTVSSKYCKIEKTPSLWASLRLT